MQTTENKFFRTPVKHQTIVGMLKSEILNGTFPPGSRMPTRDDLEERFSVSRITVQLAMDRLRREGFVITNGRNGTTVAEQPPHLYHYGIVFPGSPHNPSSKWLRYWDALDHEAKAISAVGPRKFSCYYDYTGHVDEPDYQRLMLDIRNKRLAGIFMIQMFKQIMDTIVDVDLSLPCAAIISVPHRHIPIIESQQGFLARALDHLKARGRKRIAFVTGPRKRVMDELDTLLAERGMSTEAYWQLEFAFELSAPAAQVMELLMRSDPANRPDGIVITDDNLVEAATKGLAASGVRVPEQLDVVAHCNFPYPTPSIVPSRRLGYDARRIMSTAIALIDQQRQGLKPTPISLVPLQFEDEMSTFAEDAQSEKSMLAAV